MLQKNPNGFILIARLDGLKWTGTMLASCALCFRLCAEHVPVLCAKIYVRNKKMGLVYR